jgi:hypothetical protein
VINVCVDIESDYEEPKLMMQAMNLDLDGENDILLNQPKT